MGEENMLHLPASHKLGFTINNKAKWIFGADFGFSDWSDFNKTSAYQPERTLRDLGNSMSIGAGLQFTPDTKSVSSYLKLVNTLTGLIFQQTYHYNTRTHNN